MINIVRTWTRLPARRFFVAIEKEEREDRRRTNDAKPKVGVFSGFYKMWETQMNLIVRNIQD